MAERRRKSKPLEEYSAAYRRYMDEQIRFMENEALYNRTYRDSMNKHRNQQAIVKNKRIKFDIRRKENETRLYNALIDQEQEERRKRAWEREQERVKQEEEQHRRRMLERKASTIAEQQLNPQREMRTLSRELRNQRINALENDFANRLNSEGVYSAITLNDKYRDKDKTKHDRQHEFWLTDILGLEKRREYELNRQRQYRKEVQERDQERLNRLYKEHRKLGIGSTQASRDEEIERIRRMYADTQDAKLGMDDLDAGRNRQALRLNVLGRHNARLSSEVSSLADRMRRSALYYGWRYEPDTDLDYSPPVTFRRSTSVPASRSRTVSMYY